MPGPQLGRCGPLHQVPLIQKAGLDYIRAPLVPLHIDDDASFAAAGYRGLRGTECRFNGDPAASMRQSAALLRRAWADA
ncbi:hypothetical protein [Burkholderia sp. IMCC1007]|uniref:hypothetical protein n=1 Tax=Burkholderia sp. IMCC1007 TaxID=3004104 RepID=UPI0022B392B1|nr:hypothetical protein [Burkholderia sp. IMCC1007]